MAPAADLIKQIGPRKHGLKSIRLSRGSHTKPPVSFHQMRHNLSVDNTRWWIVGLAIIVIISGLKLYVPPDTGGPTASTTTRYRTIAQLASTADMDELSPLNSDEYNVSVQLDATGDYFFKTGGTETIISRSSRKETIKYVVRSGETINTLASDFGITALTLKYANNLSSNTLKTGQELRIPPIDGLYVTVKRGDTLSALASRYKVDADSIAKYNDLTTGAAIITGQELLIPGAVVPKVQVAPKPGTNVNVPAYNPTLQPPSKFIWMLESPTHFISQMPSKRHMALDLNRLNGLGIYAAAAGVVHTKVTLGGYGRLITVTHGDGWMTYYGHTSKYIATDGQYVKQGELIAIMGSTGRSTGTHLHFEIRHNGTLLNPLDYLPR